MSNSLGRAIAAACVWIAIVLHPGVSSPIAAVQSRQIPVLLDRYFGGDFDGAIEAATKLGLDDVIDGLDRSGDDWIAAGAPVDRGRRQIAAATFALEAARHGVWIKWKTLLFVPTLNPERAKKEPPVFFLQWAAPPRLIEWGCVRFRSRSTLTAPTAAERWWNLGAIAVAERAEDTSFLLGHADRALSNTKADIRHLEHALARLPGEPRLLLSAGIALDWKTWPVAREGRRSAEDPRVSAAVTMFEQLLTHEDVGPEAALRLASLRIRTGDTTTGLDLLRKVEDQTRDKYLVYLARFFAAQVHQMEGRIPVAIASYREATRTLPGAQGAALALASLLALTDRGAEASELARAAQTLPVLDPWRGFADGDDRFWPEIVARLRKEIRP